NTSRSRASPRHRHRAHLLARSGRPNIGPRLGVLRLSKVCGQKTAKVTKSAVPAHFDPCNFAESFATFVFSSLFRLTKADLTARRRLGPPRQLGRSERPACSQRSCSARS